MSTQPDPTIRWLVAFTLGIAFSVSDDGEACDVLREVTVDPRELLPVRAALIAMAGADNDTRTRAVWLVDQLTRVRMAS
jgi:hypothetical protein